MFHRIFLFLLLFITQNLAGQQTLYRHFTVEDGLPSLTTYQITQDKTGYIWLATDKGIGKYDGYQFTNFTIKDGLPTNRIQELFVDSQNRIWLIGGDKIAYIQDDQITTISAPVEKLNIKPKGIHEWNEIIWLDTEQGIFFFEKNKLQSFELPNADWSFIGFDKNGKKIFYDKKGNIFFGKNTKSTLKIPLKEDENIDTPIFQWDKEWVYFETESQLYFYNIEQPSDTLTPIRLSSGLSLAQQTSPYLVARRFIGSLDDTLAIQKEYVHQADFRLQGAFKDREENWWLISLNDGVYLLSANAQLAQTFNTSNGLDDHFVTAVTKDKDGRVYIGTENGDLYSIEPFDNYPTLYPLNNARNIKVMSANDEFLLIGSERGLHLLDREGFDSGGFGFGFAADLNLIDCQPPSCLFEKNSTNYFISGSLTQVNDIFIKKEKLYIASGTGIWELTLDISKMKLRQLTKEPAFSVVVTHEELFTGTSEGFFQYNFKNNELSTPKTLLSHPTLQLALSTNQEVWIGTDGYGIFHFNNSSSKNPIEIPTTSTDIIEKIIIDENNTIWAATNFGVKKITTHPKNKKEYTIRPYQVADGLPTRETNTLFSDAQSIYIGTNRGFTILDKTKLSKNEASPPIFITQLFINNKKVQPQPRFRLPYFKNNLSIEFVGISIKSDKQLTYEYKLSGSDRKWQTTQNTQLDFRSLSPKRYTFRIRAIDVEGKASEEKTIQFYIKPPFWQTFWFRAILTLLLVGGIYFLFKNRVQAAEKREQEKAKIQQEKAALQLKVAEEKAEIERINNELAKSKLETLQAQMNPHFAYNALTSIQKLIFKKDNKTANKYLVKFARLMRQFLEASKETYIPLSKEIELLQLYIEMEQLRFKDKFDVKYNIDKSVNLMQVHVPSMLLQVFVENAINHGLVYKEEKGLLQFIVKQINENGHQQVVCIIEDDGIGRKKSQAIKQQTTGAYKSLGMKITHERVKYLNMMEDTEVSIKIEDDILGENGGGTRVLVIIEMPNI